MSKNLPKYTLAKQKGNIGEALVQYLLSDFCLVHKIDGSNDVGNDFICELIKDQSPTNLLFYVQVKYRKNKPTKIRKETLEYWKTSPIPVFLFWLSDTPPKNGNSQPLKNFSTIIKKYKRYTPIVHGKIKENQEPFKKFNKLTFFKDLLKDHSRTQYRKGLTPVVKPGDFLLLEDKLKIGFPQYQLLIKDVIPEYKEEIIKESWSQLFSLAVLLMENKNNQETVIALLIISRRLLLENNGKKNYSTFLDEIDFYLKELTSN